MKEYTIKIYIKFISALLIASFLFLFGACGADTVQERPEAYRIPQLSEEEIVALYNDGVKALTEADSYTMTGSVCDAANTVALDGSGEAPAAVAEAITCHVSQTNGTVCADFTAAGRQETTHNTYYDGTLFYISGIEGVEPYCIDANLYNDFLAEDYYPQISADDVLFTNLERVDGEMTVTIRLPFTAFPSEAMQQRVGLFLGEADASTVCITMTLTEEQQPVNISVSWSTEGDSGDGTLLQQALEVSFEFSNLNSTTVSAPEDLSAYECVDMDEDDGEIGSVMSNLDAEYIYCPPEEITDDELALIDWDTITWEELEALGWTRVPADEMDFD